jgi:AraC-like DNA-binding protein
MAVMEAFDQIHVNWDGNPMGIADYPAGARLGPRTCPNFEFVWIISGDVEWTCGDETFPLPQGSVCLVRPGDRDAFVWDPKKRTRHGFIHFNVDDPHQVMGPLREWPQVYHCGREEFLIRLLNHLIHLAQHPDPISQSLAQQSLKHALLCFVFRRAEGVQADSGLEEHPIIAAAMDYVRDFWKHHHMASPSVDQIAHAVGVSRGHLVRLFKQEIGMSPAHCLRGIRLDHAAMMLARSNISVQHISEECGFENQFHFSRAFKQQYRVSPRTFRQDAHAGKQRPMLVKAKIRELSRYLQS